MESGNLAHPKLRHNQQGMTILLLTVILLLISTLLVFFALQYGLLQQKISANLYRNQQAFEAAYAGTQAAIPYFQTNYALIEAGASGGFLTPYLNASTQNVAQSNSSQYTFEFSNPTTSNYQLINITSTGVNADGTSTRVIHEQIYSFSSSITPPTMSLQTQGSVSLFNTSSFNNTATNNNISAGGNAFFNGGAQSTTSSGVSSNASKVGSDVTQNDSTIASMSSSNFFQSVFGASTSTVASNATYTYNGNFIDSYNSLNGTTGSTIWINETGIGTLSGNTTIGSAAKPVILIVNGNMEFLDNVTIYGYVFIMNPTLPVFFGNNVIINGAVGSTSNLFFLGNSTVNYNSSILNALPPVGTVGNYAVVPGSWRDF